MKLKIAARMRAFTCTQSLFVCTVKIKSVQAELEEVTKVKAAVAAKSLVAPVLQVTFWLVVVTARALQVVMLVPLIFKSAVTVPEVHLMEMFVI